MTIEGVILISAETLVQYQKGCKTYQKEYSQYRKALYNRDKIRLDVKYGLLPKNRLVTTKIIKPVAPIRPQGHGWSAESNVFKIEKQLNELGKDIRLYGYIKGWITGCSREFKSPLLNMPVSWWIEVSKTKLVEGTLLGVNLSSDLKYPKGKYLSDEDCLVWYNNVKVMTDSPYLSIERMKAQVFSDRISEDFYYRMSNEEWEEFYTEGWQRVDKYYYQYNSCCKRWMKAIRCDNDGAFFCGCRCEYRHSCYSWQRDCVEKWMTSDEWKALWDDLLSPV